MSLIRVKNTLHQTAPRTRLTHSESSGTNVVRWENPNGFSASWALQLGESGHEQTEVVLLNTSAPSGTAGTLTANTLYEHPADTPVYGIKYDQVVFEKSSTGTAGTATAISGGTVTYQADSGLTIFDDTAAAAADAYRTRFRNSVLGTNTAQSDWITSEGFSFYSLAQIRQRTEDKLWSASFISEDRIIDNWTNEFKDKLTNAAIQSNEDYSLGTVDVGFGTDGLGTVTTGDFKQIRRVWVTYNGNDFFESKKMEANDDYPNRSFVSTRPQHYWFGDDILQVRPEESGGTARVMYYQMGTAMVNDTDELPRFMRGYTDGFVEYNLIQAQYKDQQISLLEKKQAESVLIRDFVSHLAPRDKSGPQMIKLFEAVDGYDSLP